MTATPKRHPAKHLINLLKHNRQPSPTFMLFLGAGASKESGVKTAREMIHDWREQYMDVYNISRAELEKEPWYNRDNEYSHLFETLYDQPSHRRQFIESCIKEAHPSWGYIYLVDLLNKEIFNTVFTTNFDDLLNEACYLYSRDVRPVVCAHDSSLASVRTTLKRPKIIKLHGDFLFDNIRNTRSEVASLDSNMENKFKQFANEYGMIVIGYAGADDAVMSNIEKILATPDGFPHGVYWCVRSGTDVNSRVLRLAENVNFKLVQIDGFDSFICEIYAALHSDQPPEIIAEPYKVSFDRLNKLVNKSRISSRTSTPDGNEQMPTVLRKHVEILMNNLQQTQQIDEEYQRLNAPSPVLVLHFLITNDMPRARSTLRDLMDKSLDAQTFRLALQLLDHEWSDDFSLYLVGKLQAQNFGTKVDLSDANDFIVRLISHEKYTEAEQVVHAFTQLAQGGDVQFREFFEINHAQVLRHQKKDLPSNLREEMSRISRTAKKDLSRFGAFIVLDDYENALVTLERSSTWSEQMTTPSKMLEWPIVKLFPRDFLRRLENVVQEADGMRKRSRAVPRIKVESDSRAADNQGSQSPRPNDKEENNK